MTTALCARAHTHLLGLLEWLARTAGHARFIVPGGTPSAIAPFAGPDGPSDPFDPGGPADPVDPDDPAPAPVPVVAETGQTTAEYALVRW